MWVKWVLPRALRDGPHHTTTIRPQPPLVRTSWLTRFWYLGRHSTGPSVRSRQRKITDWSPSRRGEVRYRGRRHSTPLGQSLPTTLLLHFTTYMSRAYHRPWIFFHGQCTIDRNNNINHRFEWVLVSTSLVVFKT